MGEDQKELYKSRKVYVGRRIEKNKLVRAWITIDANTPDSIRSDSYIYWEKMKGVLSFCQEGMIYEFTHYSDETGQKTYTGGLNAPRYTGEKWTDEDNIRTWQAKDHEAFLYANKNTMAKNDQDKLDLIAKQLEPIKRLAAGTNPVRRSVILHMVIEELLRW